MSVADSQPVEPKPKLRWFQFSLRTLLVFVTLCVIACSLLVPRIKKAIQESQLRHQRMVRDEEAAAAIWKAGGEIMTGMPGGKISCYVIFRRVTVTGADLKPLKDFEGLHAVFFDGTQIGAMALDVLSELGSLWKLELKGTNTNDESVKKFQQMLPNCNIAWTPPTPSAR